MMTAVKAYYNGTTFVPLQKYKFKPSQQVLIVVDEEAEEKHTQYSDSLTSFRAMHADFLSDATETAGLDHIFDDVRDRNEQLRGTECEEW